MACQGGRYADNTSSQGLLLKTKNLFSVAGKRLPVVMTVMAREVNKGSLSIHCGHTDFYAVRNAGGQLMSEDNQVHDARRPWPSRSASQAGNVAHHGYWLRLHQEPRHREYQGALRSWSITSGPPTGSTSPTSSTAPLPAPSPHGPDHEGQVAQDLAYQAGLHDRHEQYEQDLGHQPQGGGLLPHRRRRHGGGHPGLRRRRHQGRGGLLPACR